MNAKIYPIPGPWSGKLAIIPRPRGNDWLADEIVALKNAGIQVLVSLLTRDEIDHMGLEGEEREARNASVEFMSFPILDRDTPESTNATAAFIDRVERHLSEGKSVAIHCRQGIGRSSLISAILLHSAGVKLDEAWRRIRLSRGCDVPDTVEQKEWVRRFTSRIVTAK